MKYVSSCFFPTTVVFVDDERGMLDSMPDIYNVNAVKFTDPNEALAYINDNSKLNQLDFSSFTANGEENTSDKRSIIFDICGLSREIYNPDRFVRISAVVADYEMKSTINGIEMCAGIHNKNIQKILLTGYADESMAIAAFNENLINRFLKKGYEGLYEDLTKGINRAIYKYFNSYTEDLIKILNFSHKCHLKDPVFANFFHDICDTKNYVEYYMLDVFGSYLFLGERGEASMLSVFTENEIDKLVKFGEESCEIAPHVLNSIRSREYMLVYHDRNGMLPPIESWEKYLQPARRLDGYQTYFYSFSDSSDLDLDFDRIASFNNFRKMKHV